MTLAVVHCHKMTQSMHLPKRYNPAVGVDIGRGNLSHLQGGRSVLVFFIVVVCGDGDAAFDERFPINDNRLVGGRDGSSQGFFFLFADSLESRLEVPNVVLDGLLRLLLIV
jgi:hypothetical protein